MSLQMGPSSAPTMITSSGNDYQAQLLQAMLAGVPQSQQAAVQSALAQMARIAANKYYLQNSERKLAPCLTNGAPSQSYQLATPLTFSATTALNGFCEGIIVRWTINYTLAVGAAAVYGLTPAGALGTIDTIEVRYNKSQHKFRPQAFKQLALEGALEDYNIPESVSGGGQSLAGLQSYLNTTMPVATGAQSVTLEVFFPFNLLGPDDPCGLLPIMVGDTGIQVIVNTPLALFGADPVYNSLYPVSGTGHAVTAVSGTVQVNCVYRDGDSFATVAKLPFDLSAVQGTFQMQIDQLLTPLIAGSTPQRTKIQVMGQHAYILLCVVDGLQSNKYSTNANIAYLETAKDGIGANTFYRYGAQTNLSVQDFFYLKRLQFKQDLDEGIIPLVHGPVNYQGDPHIRRGTQYLDNTRNGWPDWRWGVGMTTVSTTNLIGTLPCVPRIEPWLFYKNPMGLIPV